MINQLKLAEKTLDYYIKNHKLKKELNYLESIGMPTLINEIFKDITKKKIKTEEIIMNKGTDEEYCYIRFINNNGKKAKLFYMYSDFNREQDIEYVIEGYCISKDGKIILNCFEIEHDEGKMDKNVIFEFDYHNNPQS